MPFKKRSSFIKSLALTCPYVSQVGQRARRCLLKRSIVAVFLLSLLIVVHSPLPSLGSDIMTKLSVFLSAALGLATSANALSVWPIPAQYSQGDKAIWLDPNVEIVFLGPQKVH
jgi:hypothetical protein